MPNILHIELHPARKFSVLSKFHTTTDPTSWSYQSTGILPELKVFKNWQQE